MSSDAMSYALQKEEKEFVPFHIKSRKAWEEKVATNCKAKADKDICRISHGFCEYENCFMEDITKCLAMKIMGVHKPNCDFVTCIIKAEE